MKQDGTRGLLHQAKTAWCCTALYCPCKRTNSTAQQPAAQSPFFFSRRWNMQHTKTKTKNSLERLQQSTFTARKNRKNRPIGKLRAPSLSLPLSSLSLSPLSSYPSLSLAYVYPSPSLPEKTEQDSKTYCTKRQAQPAKQAKRSRAPFTSPPTQLSPSLVGVSKYSAEKLRGSWTMMMDKTKRQHRHSPL